jgi:hypothetical protein
MSSAEPAGEPEPYEAAVALELQAFAERNVVSTRAMTRALRDLADERDRLRAQLAAVGESGGGAAGNPAAKTDRAGERVRDSALRGEKPWHIAPACPACEANAATPPSLRHGLDRSSAELFCAACGEHWIETDRERIALAWYSAGAWEGRNSAAWEQPALQPALQLALQPATASPAIHMVQPYASGRTSMGQGATPQFRQEHARFLNSVKPADRERILAHLQLDLEVMLPRRLQWTWEEEGTKDHPTPPRGDAHREIRQAIYGVREARRRWPSEAPS